MKLDHLFWRGLLGAVAAFSVIPDAGAARSDVYIPEDLEPWLGWVLEDREYLGCPFFFDQPQSGREHFVCAWPGQLDLELDDSGARFSQPWTVYASQQWVPLPGEGNVWPQQVSVNGTPVAVLIRGNTPSVRLAPGSYTVTGRFAWDQRPSALTIPAETGLLSLRVDGEPVTRPERAGNSVWLAERDVETRLEDSMEVQVYRLVTDDVPTRLTTVFEIDVSGNVRETSLRPALPGGFTPLALDSPLPARLESDGSLRLQVRPGHWQVRLVARGDGVLDDVTLQPPADNMPAMEIWSFEANDRLRVSVPEGLPPVDPEQVATPQEWRALPAFRVAPGESLRIDEQSRGTVTADNQLTLTRQLWLDFDGGGYVFSDLIGGAMRSGWRLDMGPPYELLSASENDANLLVTHNPENDMTGVELRQSDVNLSAVGSTSLGRVPVSGWQADFERIDATVNLPPGNKLFAALGADRAPGSWVARWELLDFFMVLILTIATTRLFNRPTGAIAFFALTLSWHEFGAAQWLWLNLLAGVALARVAPGGRLKSLAIFYRGVSLALLVIVLVPFFAQQLRIAIYPQLEPQHAVGSGVSYVRPSTPPSDAAESYNAREQMAKQAADGIEEVVVTAIRAGTSYARYAPDAIVQAGPGRPAWSWNSYALSFSGPVDEERSFRLLIMPRWFVTLLRFAAVLLLVGFAAVIAAEIFDKRLPRFMHRSGVAPALLIATMFAAGALTPGSAKAQTPGPEILQQLEQRLLEPPPCAPRCAEIVAATVEVNSDTMSIQLSVHSLDEVAVPLPGSLSGWRPESVLLDGTGTQVFRRADQTLWVRASAGTNRITLAGPLPPVDRLEIPFPSAPRQITASSESWTVNGIRDRRLVSGSLELERLQSATRADGAARWESTRFPVFVRIERMISLDLDWRVTTQVVRVAPQQGALSVQVPLLDGESVVSETFNVRDGAVAVSMRPGQNIVTFESTLPRTSPLVLRAGVLPDRKEVWRVATGRIWRVHFDGVPESDARAPFSEARVAEFYPRSGEHLTVEVERPQAAGGTTLAFDNVSLQTEVGTRSRTVEMVLEYRSTRGAQHTIGLPDAAEVLSVNIDGRNEPLRASDGQLSVPVVPGEHNIQVRWRQDLAAGLRDSSPSVDLHAAASNIKIGMRMPPDRWILFTSGPRLGPAVMYWSELAVLLLVAIVLGRTGLTPLKVHHWLLLGLGFSTFSWVALMVVAAWLLVAGARAKWQQDLGWWRFDVLQLLIAALTIGALAAIVITVPAGLLGAPDMHIVGNNSWGNALHWFADRSESTVPMASVISVPVWVYKVLILAWALWLSFAVLRWLRWVWSRFVSEGLWRPRPPRKVAADEPR